MAMFAQNAIVVLVVAGCAWHLVRVARRAMNAKCGEAGSCCSGKKGAAVKRPTTGRVDFLPVEMLSRKK